MRRNSRQISVGKSLQVSAAILAMATLAACSTSADRFGPFGGQQASGGTGYSSNNGSAGVDNTYTASIPPSNRVDSTTVTSVPVETTAPIRTAHAGSVVVMPGDTLFSIARANNVHVRQLSAANSIAPPYNINIGQTLTLPGHGYARAATAAPVATAAARPVSSYSGTVRSASGSGQHVVAAGDTLYSVARNNGMKANILAQHNRIGWPYTLKVGQRLRIPAGGDLAGGTLAAAPARPVAQAKRQSVARAAPTVKVASVPKPDRKPASDKNFKKAKASSAKVAAARPAAKPVRSGKLPKPRARSGSKFRWPVRGRVISRFGAKPNGSKNDGINIAVPEGTSVKAAENGVVAYAGNELKGYGNLVLIRHSGNWVTAYAHNKNLLVRRGQRVKRGQVISKAGRTGSVTSPQLHFEIRKGSSAVNPLKSLESSKVAGG